MYSGVKIVFLGKTIEPQCSKIDGTDFVVSTTFESYNKQQSPEMSTYNFEQNVNNSSRVASGQKL